MLETFSSVVPKARFSRLGNGDIHRGRAAPVHRFKRYVAKHAVRVGPAKIVTKDDLALDFLFVASERRRCKEHLLSMLQKVEQPTPSSGWRVVCFINEHNIK